MSSFLFCRIQTSYSTLFALYHLATNPDKQQLLFEEVSRLNPTGGPLTPAHLNQAKYLHAVVKENLRLNPVFPFVARLLTDDLVIRGYRIPAGVRFLPLIMHSNQTKLGLLT